MEGVRSLAVQNSVLNATEGGDGSQKEEKWTVRKEALPSVVICQKKPSQLSATPIKQHFPAWGRSLLLPEPIVCLRSNT
jgi:hypothetical protein